MNDKKTIEKLRSFRKHGTSVETLATQGRHSVGKRSKCTRKICWRAEKDWLPGERDRTCEEAEKGDNLGVRSISDR